MTHGGAVRQAALAGILLASIGCGSRPTAPQTPAPVPSAPPAPTASAAAPTPQTTPNDNALANARADGYVDPSKLLEAYDVGDHATETASKPSSNSGLMLEVRERGPNQPWLVYLVNRGDAPAELVADTRLLWFEVKPPVKPAPEKSATGKAVKSSSKPAPTKPIKPSLCRLPDALSTGSVPEPRLVVHLEPGEGVADQFDPRLYCFAEGDQRLLVPGAEIIPHFGWPEAPPRSRWKHGKRVEEPVLQKPPFVARLSADSDNGNRHNTVGDAASPKAVARLSSAGVTGSDKQIQGEPFTLQSEYAIWSHQIPRPADSATDSRSGESATPPRLALRLVQGSDAKAEHDATIKLSLSSQSPLPIYVYFRREMVSFEVAGPMGVTQCHGRLDERSPERSAFLHLTPKASHSYDSRLAELCPRGTFAIPGLYLVYARFDATISGQDRGIDAFIGSVYSHRAAPVRIRTGEQAIFQKRPMLRTDAANSPSTRVNTP
ncbi:MAG TPA: hypothetical protein VIV60_28065 [Polyangiaceae bacterium]